MKTPTTFLFVATHGLAFAGGSAGTEDRLISPAPAASGWRLQSVSAGLGWRSLGQLDYQGGSRLQDFLIPSVVGGNAISVPAIGMIDVLGNRTYDNGFVNLDSTGSTDNETWFWGYDTASQASGNDLRFNASGSRSDFTESRTFAGAENSDKTLEALTPQIDFLLAPPSSLNFPIDGFLVSLWVFSDDSSNRFSNFSAQQQRDDFRLDFEDTFDVTEILPLIGEGYAGTADGPGPVIPNLPSERDESEVPLGGDSATFRNSVSTSLDLDGYSLALGPTWSGTIGNDWIWQASAGLTLNLFKWSASESETLSYSLNGADSIDLRTWRESNSGTDFRFGVYTKGEVLRRITDDWFAKASLQLEMADSVKIDIGDSEYEFKPRGYALGLSLGHQF